MDAPEAVGDQTAAVVDLGDEVARLVAGGWPVVPVRTPLAGRTLRVPRHALVSTIPSTATHADAAADWTDPAHEYGVATEVGRLFDVLAVPPSLGPAVRDELAAAGRRPAGRPVVAVIHPSRWWFPVLPGAPCVEDFPVGNGVWLLRDGHLLLPPTPTAAGPVRWAGPPGRGTALNRLPHGLTAQWSAVRACWSARRVVDDERIDR